MAGQFLNGEPLNVPNFSSGFWVKFCVFWNSWNDVQTSKLVIDSKFNVIILTNIIFDVKTSFFKDLEITNLGDDWKSFLLNLQFVKIHSKAKTQKNPDN